MFKVFHRRKNVCFVYDEEHLNTGSTVMRAKQLSEIAGKYLNGYDIKSVPSNQGVRNSILLLTKNVIKTSQPAQLEIMKKNKNLLIYDPVDAKISEEAIDYADVVVAASLTAFDDYRKLYPKKRIAIVNHHVDPRIKLLDWAKAPDSFKAAYFGELVNTITTQAIKRQVDFVHVDTSRQTSGWLNKLPLCNFHYAIRSRRKNDHHKPFLKGFTAAASGANILIQDSEEEALRWLGKDYPYLLRGPLDEKNILGKLEHAKQSFGSNEWKTGLEIMKNIKEKNSEEAIGRQLRTLIREASKL